MFSLIYGFFQYMLRKEQFHFLILGLDSAGKTTLLEKIKGEYGPLPGLEPSAILPTVGLNVGRIEAFKASLIFWDLGGQKGLRSIWDKYYSESHAVMFVVDAANSERFAESKAALQSALANGELLGAPLLVYANKQDVESAAKERDIEAALSLQMVEDRPVRVQPLSALSGDGLSEGLTWAVEQVKRSPRAVLLARKQ